MTLTFDQQNLTIWSSIWKCSFEAALRYGNHMDEVTMMFDQPILIRSAWAGVDFCSTFEGIPPRCTWKVRSDGQTTKLADPPPEWHCHHYHCHSGFKKVTGAEILYFSSKNKPNKKLIFLTSQSLIYLIPPDHRPLLQSKTLLKPHSSATLFYWVTCCEMNRAAVVCFEAIPHTAHCPAAVNTPKSTKCVLICENSPRQMHYFLLFEWGFPKIVLCSGV